VTDQVLFGAVDAERDWRPEGLAVLPAPEHPAAADAAVDELLLALAGPRDVVLGRAPLPAAQREVLAAAGLRAGHVVPSGTGPVEDRLLTGALRFDARARPYGVTRAVVAAAHAAGLRLDCADPALAARVNSKTWSNGLVRRLGLAGAGHPVRSVAQLRAAIAQIDAPVLVKDPYGAGGRGTVEVATRRALEALAADLDRQVAAGADVELLVQRRYERAADLSAHFHLGATTTFEGLRATGYRGGAFVGAGPLDPAAARWLDEHDYPELAAEVAAEVAAAGYRGPVCVDSMLTAETGLVAVVEINARVSLGLVSLALRRLSGEAVLRERSVPVLPWDDPYERIASGLADRGLLAEGGRPGFLPLTAGTLRPPRGRLLYAVLGDGDAPPEEALTRLLADLGLSAPRGGVRVG
jgi:hypothetical protein